LPALLGTRRLGREPVSVSGGGVVDFLSLAHPAAVDIFPFYLCPDFTHLLVPGLYHSFPPESSLDEFVNYKTHYYSNHRLFFVLFALYSPVDFADTLLKGHFASSRIGAALLHQQHPLFRLTSDRRDYAE